MLTNWTDENIKTDYPLYPYQPNTLLPIICAIVFAVGLVYHVAITSMRGAFQYWWPFLMGMSAEVVGYIFRRMSAEKPLGTNNLGIYAASMVGIVVAPALFAAAFYRTYSRIIAYVGPERSPIKRVTVVFILTDMFSILIQSTGSTLFSSSDPKKVKLAKNILIIGFVIQLIGFSTFMAISMIFYRRVKRDNIPTARWSVALKALWVACFCILLRSIYRTLEFATGGTKDGVQSGWILEHEILFYIFETIMCVIAAAAVSLCHPSFYLPRDRSETLQILPTAGWKQPS